MPTSTYGGVVYDGLVYDGPGTVGTPAVGAAVTFVVPHLAELVAPSEIRLSDRGGGNLLRLPVSDTVCSWVVSGAGQLSALVAAADYRASGLDDTLGQWLTFSHPTAGDWLGIVQDEHWDSDKGTCELVAESFAINLRGRRTIRNYKRDDDASAGGLILRSLSDAAHEDPLWLTAKVADEDGYPIRYAERGADLYDDLLRTLVQTTGYEWWVDENRAFRWQARIGVDRAPTVVLAEGRHVASFRYTRTRRTIVNDLVAVAADRDYEAASAFQVEDRASVLNYGRLQANQVFKGLTSKSTLEPRARADLKKLKDPGQTLEVTLVDADNVFSLFREGDSVRTILGSCNADLRFRVMGRSLDVNAGTLTCTGDATAFP